MGQAGQGGGVRCAESRSVPPCADASDPLTVLYLRIDRRDIAFVKFVFESYEGVAVVRTLDRQAAVIVVLVATDFIEAARRILDSLRASARFEEIAAPPEAEEDWLLRLMR